MIDLTSLTEPELLALYETSMDNPYDEEAWKTAVAIRGEVIRRSEVAA